MKSYLSPIQAASGYQKQGGIAIITAILCIALGTVTIVAIASSQQFDLQRERNEGLIQQARSFGISGERFAAALLFRDAQAEDRGNSDSLEDDWALTIPPVPIDNASLQGCVVDMQGRFNLNNLVDLEGMVQPAYVAQFRRLLVALNIAVEKSDAVVDWVDSDLNFTAPEGAEDDFYTSLEVGYRAANAPFVSVSELQLVKGFTSAVEEQTEDYELLLPHVSVLSVDNGATAVNVNTATPEVLASLSDGVMPAAADLSRWDTSAYEDYPECENIFDLEAEAPQSLEDGQADLTPFESAEDFINEVPRTDPEDEVAIDVAFDTSSNYFQVRINVEAEGITLSQFTLLERDAEGRTRVVYRSRDTL